MTVCPGPVCPRTMCPLDDASLTDMSWPWTAYCRQWVINSATCRNWGFPGALQSTGKPKLCPPIPTHGPHQNCLASGLYLSDLTYPNICNGRPLAIRNGSYWDASSKRLIVQIAGNPRHIVQGRNVQELSFRDTLFGEELTSHHSIFDVHRLLTFYTFSKYQLKPTRSDIQ